MSSPSKEFVGTWQELAAHAQEFGERRLRLIVLEPAEADFPPDSLEARLIAIAAKVPKEEWDKLPPDLTDRLDHYIYGPSSE